MTTYHLCVLLIRRERIEGLKEKLDAFLAADRLTVEQYKTLVDSIK